MNLEQKYDRDAFLIFLKSFVPKFVKDIRHVNTNGLQVTKEAFYLGKSDEFELEVFELAHSSSNDARVALAKDGFKVMKNSATYRALVIYQTATGDDWRLSLMTAMPGVNQKGKIGQSFSNPRRFSFFLGPNAKINTPYQLLIKQGAVKDFEELQERFSLEVVNEEFYTKIARLFTKLAGGKRQSFDAGMGLIKLPSSVDDTLHKEFTVRLIGRLVFCWFLKKKRSNEALSLVPEELLSSKTVKENNEYYHNILEPLFFEVLNTPIEERKKKYKTPPWSRVPFLNGGLFSEHRDDFYELGTLGISKHINTLIIPDEWIRELFEVFETYNFTIDESTSVDIELSIDPEMLGRIFENLLAEIVPETGETARKSTGSYYTPRIIVDCMVEQALMQYLLTKTALPENKINNLLSYEDDSFDLTDDERNTVVRAVTEIKVIDPAVGSGAFPIGILHRMLLVLEKVDPTLEIWRKHYLNTADVAFRQTIEESISRENWSYLRKLIIIRECIYGIDIQPIAVEISKLRCFLSLVVDEYIDDSALNRGIKSLPNLEFKFVAANSLIGLPMSKDFQLFEEQALINKLSKLRKEYFNSYGAAKTDIEQEFNIVQKKMSEHYLKHTSTVKTDFTGVSRLTKGSAITKTQLLAQWKPFSNESTGWSDPEWMFGVSEFDVVIANPPYIFSREKLTSQDKAIYNKLYSLTQFKINLYILFIERSFNLLRKNGSLAFITPNNWLTLSTTSDLRHFLLTQTYNIHIILNYDNVFENASVDTCTLIFRKTGDQTIRSSKWTKNGIEITGRHDTEYYLQKKNYIFGDFSESDSGAEICSKINSESTLLSCLADVKNGVQAYTVGEGDPILTEEMKDRRVYHSNMQKGSTWFKYLDGVDVDRYRVGWSGQFIKYGRNLSRPREPYLFNGERLLVRQIPGQLPYCILACYTDEHAINDNNSMIIKVNDDTIDLKYLLGIINSKLISFWFAQTFGKLQRKIFPQFKIKELRTFPIKKANSTTQQLAVISVVNQILRITKDEDYSTDSGKQTKLNKLNAKIDLMVYDLYGLTLEEKGVVEKYSNHQNGKLKPDVPKEQQNSDGYVPKINNPTPIPRPVIQNSTYQRGIFCPHCNKKFKVRSGLKWHLDNRTCQ